MQGFLQGTEPGFCNLRSRHRSCAELEEGSLNSASAGDGWMENIYFTSVSASFCVFAYVKEERKIYDSQGGTLYLISDVRTLLG